MPMPPYLRFSENESIQQRFWGLRPRNPTCGKISLETGAKTFAWGNIVFYGSCALFAVFATLMLIATFSNYPSHQELIQGLKQSTTRFSGELPEDWVAKMHIKQSHSLLIVVCLMALVFSCILLRLSWNLKKAITERDVPLLKKYFVIMVVLEIFYILFFDIETEMVWTATVFFDIVITFLKICGLIFTYSYIVSLISPDSSSQDEDLNRIQFSP